MEVLGEGLPRNNTSGIYALNDPGFRLGQKDPRKVYYPDADGNWPAGIPGTPGELEYVRPEGYWSGGRDWDSQVSTDFSQDYLTTDPTGKSTDKLIGADGTVFSALPPGSENFILGPIVDGFVPNHTSDAYTNIGYIQKDTRQFVLLARINGQWKAGLNGSSSYPVWGGTSSGLTIYNQNFTLEMAQWVRDKVLANSYVSNVPYFYSGGVPQRPQGPADCPNCPPGMYGGNGIGPRQFGSGGNPSIGSEQGAAKGGNEKDAGYPWGKDDKKKKDDKDKVYENEYGWLDKNGKWHRKRELTDEEERNMSWEERMKAKYGPTNKDLEDKKAADREKYERESKNIPPDWKGSEQEWRDYKAGGGDAAIRDGKKYEDVIKQGRENREKNGEINSLDKAFGIGGDGKPSKSSLDAYKAGGGDAAVRSGKSIQDVMKSGQKNIDSNDPYKAGGGDAAVKSGKSRDEVIAQGQKNLAYKAGGGDAALRSGKSQQDIIAQGEKNLSQRQDQSGDIKIGSVNLSDPNTQNNINTALTIADAALMVASIIGILIPEPTTTAAGAAGLVSLLTKVGRVVGGIKTAKTIADKSKNITGEVPPSTPKLPQGPKQPDGTPPLTGTDLQGKPLPKGPQPQEPSNPYRGPLSGQDIPKGQVGGGTKPTSPTPPTSSGGGLKGAGSVRVGATGLKQTGFKNVTGGQAPKATSGPTILDPTGKGVVYSAPKVGQIGPNPIAPGTGASRYAMGNANPLKAQEGPGGVVGSLVPSNAPKTGSFSAEPQMAVPSGLAEKGIRIFKDVQSGKYANSPTANKIRQMAQDAGFAPGQSSIPASQLPKTNAIGGIMPNPQMSTTGLKFGVSTGSRTTTRKESYIIEEISDDDFDILMKNPKFRKRLPDLKKGIEKELELIQLYDALFGIEGVDKMNENYFVDKKSYLVENRARILREIKKPVVVPELPKKYKMNFAGKYSAQNTPDKTASKLSDELVASGNARGQRWRMDDKYWQGYETTERMNIIYDRVGHGDQYWEEIINENKRKNAWKTKEMQEHLNIMAHEKAMKEENPNYESPFYKEYIKEQETIQADKDPLFKKIASKLKKEIDYPDKPSKNGVPNEPPPEMVNGYHPNFGKRKDYYKRLDPQSASAMPETGDPETDAQVKAARKKPK